MRIPLLTALTLAATLAAVPALAQPPGGPFPGHDGGPGMAGERLVERLGDVLKLDANQAATLETLAKQMAAAVRPLHEQQRGAFEQLHANLDGANPDPTAIGRQVIAMHGVRKQIEAARQSFDSGLTSILSSEQKAVYEAMKEQMFGGPGGPGGPRGPRGMAGRHHGPGMRRFGGPR